VNYQEQTLSALEYFLEWLMQLPVVGERITLLLSDESTATHMTATDLESFIFSAWAVLSLVFMLAGFVLSSLFGPFKPWTLKRKILIAGAGAVLLLAGMAVNYYAAPKNFNGDASSWMLNFSLISLLVFGVSAYCLSVAHFLAYLNEALMAGELNNPDDSGILQ
jgi:4-amino-4-deoxy-L-arabinose transferase-like glycosyltransferase